MGTAALELGDAWFRATSVAGNSISPRRGLELGLMGRVRRGGYRQSFFSPEQMQVWSIQLWPQIRKLRLLFEQNLLSQAELVAEVMLLIWKEAKPNTWRNGRLDSNWPAEFCQTTSPGLRELTRFQLRGLPPLALEILPRWHLNQIPLQLFFHIPSPQEVLEFQSRGARCVSLLIETPDQFAQGHPERDSFSFALHDLIHASHFFKSPQHWQTQMNLAKWLRACWEAPELQMAFAKDSELSHRLEYLASDMNSHLLHTLKCLKSALNEQPKLEPLFLNQLFCLFDYSEEDQEQWLKHWRSLNREGETTQTHQDLFALWSLRVVTPRARLHNSFEPFAVSS